MFGRNHTSEITDLVMTTDLATDEELGFDAEMEVDQWETECAWCLSERGIVPLSGSHGICQAHSLQVLQSHAARRRG